MKKQLSTIIFALIFLAGLSLFLYPMFSNLWNEHLNHGLIKEYTDTVANISSEEYRIALENARTYNKHLYEKEKLSELGLSYNELLNLNGDGIMGYMEIPKISTSLVLYHGTEDKDLQRGIGHVETSALPVGGEGTHCVLAGHTGLPSAKLLTNLDRLQNGDVFYIHILNEVLEYRVDQIVVVEPHEVDHLMAEAGKDYVTIVTCTPYGINSHRLLVRGSRVTAGGSDHSVLTMPDEVTYLSPYLTVTAALIALAIPVILLTVLLRARKRKKEKKEETDESN